MERPLPACRGRGLSILFPLSIPDPNRGRQWHRAPINRGQLPGFAGPFPPPLWIREPYSLVDPYVIKSAKFCQTQRELYTLLPKRSKMGSKGKLTRRG